MNIDWAMLCRPEVFRKEFDLLAESEQRRVIDEMQIRRAENDLRLAEIQAQKRKLI